MTSCALGDADMPWQQRFSSYCKALFQLQGFFIPDVLNEREESPTVSKEVRSAAGLKQPPHDAH